MGSFRHKNCKKIFRNHTLFFFNNFFETMIGILVLIKFEEQKKRKKISKMDKNSLFLLTKFFWKKIFQNFLKKCILIPKSPKC